MEKLIELLNKEMEEKEKAWPKLARFTSYDGINKVFNLNNGCSFCVEFVLSKRYGFIKWLCGKNKIDLLKLDSRIALSWFNKVERVLMALTIQENPISFLIDILK